MIPFAALMAVAVPIIVLWTRMSLPKYVGRWNRKKGPPDSGHMVTLVLTDVEGSTELWEAFQEVTFLFPITTVNKSLMSSLRLLAFIQSCREPVDYNFFCGNHSPSSAPWLGSGMSSDSHDSMSHGCDHAVLSAGHASCNAYP